MPRKKSEQDVVWDLAVGRNIEAARRRANMTGVALARAVGISQQRLYWYETGRTGCPTRILRKIEAATGRNITSLIPSTTVCA